VTADKIYLVGFMACGKSMLARTLGARLDWRVEDIDDLIEVRERQTIADIFAKQGEPYFGRSNAICCGWSKPIRQAVVATGGGTFADADNRALINLDGVSSGLTYRSTISSRASLSMGAGRSRPAVRTWSGSTPVVWRRTGWRTSTSPRAARR
jgi:shikimate kinase